MNNFGETKIFEPVRIEYVNTDTGEVYHLTLAFMGWQALAKYCNSLEKSKKWKVTKIKKE